MYRIDLNFSDAFLNKIWYVVYLLAIEVSTEEKFDGRLIHISLNKEKCRLIVLSHENKALRVVDFAPLDVVELWAANDELYNLLLFRLQKECDLVSLFCP